MKIFYTKTKRKQERDQCHQIDWIFLAEHQYCKITKKKKKRFRLVLFEFGSDTGIDLLIKNENNRTDKCLMNMQNINHNIVQHIRFSRSASII